MMNRQHIGLALGIGVAVLAVASLVAWTGSTSHSPDHAAPNPAPGNELDGSKRRETESSPRAQPVDHEHDGQTQEQRDAERRRQTRQLLQRKYGRAHNSAEPDEGSEREPLDDPRQPAELPPNSWSLPEEYIQGVLEDQLIPAAKSCYEDIAPPGTSGELTFSVAVIGDSEIGGIIDEVNLKSDESSIEGELSECIRQASYALEFDPPEAGRGVEEFDFTMRFDSDEEPG